MKPAKPFNELSKIILDGPIPGSPTPPITMPPDLGYVPEKSPVVTIATSNDKFNVLWTADDNSGQVYVVDPDPKNISIIKNSAQPSNVIVNWWGRRPDYTMTMRRYWQPIFWTQVVTRANSTPVEFCETLMQTYGIDA